MQHGRKFTAVLIAYRKNRLNHRIIFGEPASTVRLGWRRKLEIFEPGQIFAYERWRANSYGTQDWRFYVLKALSCGTMTRVPGVTPGGEVLFAMRGSTRTKRALKLLTAIKRDGADPARLSPHEWRGLHNQVETGAQINELVKEFQRHRRPSQCR